MPFLAKLKKAFIPPDPKAQYAAPAGVQRTQAWLQIAIGDQPVGKIEIGELVCASWAEVGAGGG